MANKMFCPKCGKADQTPETYCRGCGTFLPDLAKAIKKVTPPEEHITANTFFSAMTIVVSFTLAALLYLVLAFKPETHALIYITAGFLLAMGGWHIQTLWRTRLLRKHLKKPRPPTALEKDKADNLLETPNFDDYIPASVIDKTTNKLRNKR